MDIYQGFFSLKPGTRDMAFAIAFDAWMEALKERGVIEGARLMRRKLGFGPQGLGDWQFLIEVRDLAQLEEAFRWAASRAEPAEGLHHQVNHMVEKIQFGLYRDFPDAFREEGQERF